MNEHITWTRRTGVHHCSPLFTRLFTNVSLAVDISALVLLHRTNADDTGPSSPCAQVRLQLCL